jgi:hypothetical protein
MMMLFVSLKVEANKYNNLPYRGLLLQISPMQVLNIYTVDYAVRDVKHAQYASFFMDC